MDDPKVTLKEVKWAFRDFTMSAVFRFYGTPELGYLYVYQLFTRERDKLYAQLYDPKAFTFKKARKHFQKSCLKVFS